MPRQGRLHITGAYYHVLGRGLERRDIFSKDIDKIDFLNRLGRGLVRTSIQCMAWAVMSNHYHLLLRTNTAPLSRLMTGLLGGYAYQYNRRERRAGYVFQGRFTSILCETEPYFLALVRYIHLNPLHAGLVADIAALDNYRWTGHATLLGNGDCGWQNTGEVLARFGTGITRARRNYRNFVNDGRLDSQKLDFDGGGVIRSAGGWEALSLASPHREKRLSDERILGSSEFVESILAQHKHKRTPATNSVGKVVSLTQLRDHICDYFDLDYAAIAVKGRNNSRANARSLLCYLGNTALGIPQREIAAALAMSQSGVAKACVRGRRYCEMNALTLADLIH